MSRTREPQDRDAAYLAWPETHPVARALMERAPTPHGWGGSWGGLVRRELRRYYALLRRERERLLDAFRREEIAALVDVLAHAVPDEATGTEGGDVVLAILRQRRRELADRWGVDGDRLADTYAALCLGQKVALADIVERWLIMGADDADDRATEGNG